MPTIWLLIALVSLIVEVLATHFVLLFVAIAAMCAGLLAMMPTSIPVQVIAFCATSLLLLLTLRAKVVSRFKGRGVSSRAESLIGFTALVTADISPHQASGRVAVNGEDWKASSDAQIESGKSCLVVAFDGIELIVEPLVEDDWAKIPQPRS